MKVTAMCFYYKSGDIHLFPLLTSLTSEYKTAKNNI